MSSPGASESGRWWYLDPTGHGKRYELRGLAEEKIGIVEAEGIQRECGGRAVARFRYGLRSRWPVGAQLFGSLTNRPPL
jgi:hypothetical protein